MQTHAKSIKVLKERKKRKGLKLQFYESIKWRTKTVKCEWKGLLLNSSDLLFNSSRSFSSNLFKYFNSFCPCSVSGRPGYIQNYNSYPHDLPSFPQQYPCCEGCKGPHETFKCQSMNYYEPNLCYNSISSDFDQFQPSQFPVIHQPPQETSVKILHDQKNVINSVQTILRKFNRYSFFETPQELFRKLFNDVQNIHEELAEYINTPSWNRPAFYNNDKDDDEDYTIAVTPDFPITDSLSMGDEHFSTISETESDELIKSSVENLVSNLSKFEGLSEDSSNIESECDVPVCDDFTTFSNSLFDADDNFSSSDDESFFDENVLKGIYSNPLFDEEIISIKIDPHHFNVDSDLIKSLLNQDSLIISSPKFDSLLEEFFGELAHIDLIPPGINEADFDPEEEILESFSPSPILVEESDSLMEEIDLFLTPDDSMPSGIKNDDYDSEGDILFLEELLSNDSFSLPENESFHFDIPSSPRPPAKPPDDDEIEPDMEF
nr:hypothetical protein [Tanacetum cinerariifolium]